MKLLAKITATLTLAAALCLTACETGGNTGTTNPPSSVFASKTAIPAGDPNCANGGVQIDMGFDENGNNVLDSDEITSTEYVCNGQDASSHPFVVYTSPTPNETGVELDAVISAVFNIEMNPDTINDTTFTVKDAAGNPVAGTVTCNGIVAVFQPAQPLVMNTKYTVTLSSAMQNDAAGIEMGYDHKFYFTTWSEYLYIGMPYQGGVIAYIYQYGEPGYVPGQIHGLIAATGDQSTMAVWISGGSTQTTFVPGGTGTAIGSGSVNTDRIILQAVAAGNNDPASYAAGLARSYNGGGYTDWYLPSKDELNKLFLNRTAIGGFAGSAYWSSSEDSAYGAWAQNFSSGLQGGSNKNGTYRVRAVRSF